MKKTITLVLPMMVGMIFAATPKAGAWAWVDTSAWDTWNNGGYWLQQDAWGTSSPNQTIYANSYSNWEVVCNYSGGGIKAYPAVGRDIGKTVTSLKSLSSSYSDGNPGGSYDNAYDIWMNGGSYEVMIWQSWNGTQPIASSYNAQGQAIPYASNVSIGGTTYNFYERGSVFSFLRTGQTHGATTNILAVLQYLNNNHWFNNPTCTDVQFGWEIINTNGSGTFNMNSYSCTFS